MTATRGGRAGHPVSRILTAVSAEMDDTANVPTWSMSPAEQREALVELAAVESRVTALRLRVLRQAEGDDAGSASGATSTAAWHANATGQTVSQAYRLSRQAAKLDRHDPVAAALAAGEVRLDQAEVIVDAVDALPTDLVDEAVRDRAREQMLALATGEPALDAPRLRKAGQRILEVVAPEVADEHLRRLLEAQERRAAQQTRLTMSDDGQGCVHGRFTLPVAVAAMLRAALRAIAAPKHQLAVHGAGSLVDATGQRKERPLRLGDAFAEYVSRYSADDLPTAGGVNATVVVTMDLATLLGAERAATLDTGDALSAGKARQLACEAGIIPFVLGGPTEALDAGRLKRFHARAHDPAYTTVLQHDGSVTFHRRT